MGKIKTVLFAANPASSKPLSLDKEIRAINRNIRSAEYRDAMELLPAMAAQPDDLLQILNEQKPQVVHFSGHGNPTGEIFLVDQFGLPKAVKPKTLKALFNIMKDNIRLVVFNACYSKIQAQGVIQSIDCVVGMGKAISDKAAITFAGAFYRALGFGRSIKEAFEQAKLALMLEGIEEENTPELLVKKGIDPARVCILGPVPPDQGDQKPAVSRDDATPSAKQGGPVVDELLKNGLIRLELQDYDGAGKIFREAEEKFPANDRARFLHNLSLLAGKPILSIDKPEMNSITLGLKEIALGDEGETANLARLVLGITWYDYYLKIDHRYQEFFFKQNTRYLANYKPKFKEKELLSHIECSESARVLTGLGAN